MTINVDDLTSKYPSAHEAEVACHAAAKGMFLERNGETREAFPWDELPVPPRFVVQLVEYNLATVREHLRSKGDLLALKSTPYPSRSNKNKEDE